MTTLKHILVYLLTLEAKIALRRHTPKVIAVTGSVGKTSTKDAVYTAVKGSYFARKSEKSFNSEIGLPLTILGLPNAWGSAGGWLRNLTNGLRVAFSKAGSDAFPELLVLEIGADHPGDIERVSKWLSPDIVVLTRMSETPVHVEYFSGPEDVLKEKMFLARALRTGGTLVVNADDPLFMKAASDMDRHDIRTVLYGESKEADSHIIRSEVSYGGAPLHLPRGQHAVIKSARGETTIELSGVLGRHLVYPIAAAHAVAGVLGKADRFEEAFARFAAPKGRMNLLPGRSSTVILDDTYNSSPLACEEAVRTLGSLTTRGRKIAVLADMKELGEFSQKAHREVGALAGETVHTLVTVGEMGREMAVGARLAGLASDRIYSFDESREAGKALADIVRAGDVILVKGSQSMRMERAVAELLDDPSKAGELLVRQEEEWLRK